MSTNAFNFSLATFVAGIFGFFLRWLQTLNGFEENGLAIPGALTGIVFAVYSLVVLLAFIVANRLVLRKNQLGDKASEVLYVGKFIPTALMWVVGGLMVIVCLVLMFGSDFARYPTMQRMTAALGIFTGLCLPFILRRKAEGEDGGIGGIAAVIPVLFGCLWLVTNYRVESENPVLWSYVVEMLGIVASTLAFYYVAAFFYGRAKPARCLLALEAAVYLNTCTLMDNHSTVEKLLFGCLAGAFLIFIYVLLSNTTEKKVEAE